MSRFYLTILACLVAIVVGVAMAVAGRALPTEGKGLSASPLTPVGSGFLYQGRLTDGGVPANGNYDFRLTMAGSTITLTNQLVNNGLFKVSLNFGDEPFDGSSLSLGIGVRVSGGGAFTTLTNQTLRHVPYAQGARWSGTTGKPAPFSPLRSVNVTSVVSGVLGISDPAAVTIGADGLPLVAFDGVDGVNAAHCDDLACTSFTNSLLFTGLLTGRLDATLGTDGLVLIVGTGSSNDLVVAHCSNVQCTSATVTSLDSAGTLPSINIGGDSRGLISYTSNGDLKVAHCSNVNCTAATTTTVDSPGSFPSLTIGADALGLIAYWDDTLKDLKAAHCSNTNCTSATITTLADLSVLSAGETASPSIATGVDGLGLISYWDTRNGFRDLTAAHCDDANCASATISTVDTSGDVGRFSSIVTGPDGLGLISYFDRTNFDLKFATCKDVACTGAVVSVLDNNVGDGVVNTDITWGVDGLPVVTYYAAAGPEIRFLHCGSPTCVSFSHPR